MRIFGRPRRDCRSCKSDGTTPDYQIKDTPVSQSVEILEPKLTMKVILGKTEFDSDNEKHLHGKYTILYTRLDYLQTSTIYYILRVLVLVS